MKKIFLILLAAVFVGAVFTGCDETGADVNLLMGTWSGDFSGYGITVELTEAGGFVVDFVDNADGYTATYSPAPAEQNEMLSATITAITKNTIPIPLDVGDSFSFSLTNLAGSGTGATVNLNIYENGDDQPPEVYPLTML